MIFNLHSKFKSSKEYLISDFVKYMLSSETLQLLSLNSTFKILLKANMKEYNDGKY